MYTFLLLLLLSSSSHQLPPPPATHFSFFFLSFLSLSSPSHSRSLAGYPLGTHLIVLSVSPQAPDRRHRSPSRPTPKAATRKHQYTRHIGFRIFRRFHFKVQPVRPQPCFFSFCFSSPRSSIRWPIFLLLLLRRHISAHIVLRVFPFIQKKQLTLPTFLIIVKQEDSTHQQTIILIEMLIRNWCSLLLTCCWTWTVVSSHLPLVPKVRKHQSTYRLFHTCRTPTRHSPTHLLIHHLINIPPAACLSLSPSLIHDFAQSC